MNQWANKTPTTMVEEFHLAFGHPVAFSPGIPKDPDLISLREKLITEEYEEVIKAIKNNDIVNLAKELADLIYVIEGCAIVYGIPLGAVVEAVHESNMSKLDENGKPVIRNDGKVLKGKNYKEPDIERILFPK